MDFNKSMGIAIKTGKVLFGTKNAIKNAKTGKVKLIILANNCSSNLREEIEYYCKLSKISTFTYDGTSKDLGIACGKIFIVSVVTIRDPGESEILELTEVEDV